MPPPRRGILVFSVSASYPVGHRFAARLGQRDCLKVHAVCETVYGYMRYKDLLGLIAREGIVCDPGFLLSAT